MKRRQARRLICEELEARRVLATIAFQQPLEHSGTALHETGSTWEFNLVNWDNQGKLDLAGVKKSGTGSGKTELHVFSNNYQTQVSIATALHQTGTNWEFEVADWDRNGSLDLIGINSSAGSGMTEVHVLDGSNNYQSFLQQSVTGLSNVSSSGWDFEVANWNGGTLDLVAINRSGAGGTIDVHVMDGSNMGTFLLQSSAALPNANSNWEFEMAESSKHIIAIKKANTGTGTSEAHILNGDNNFNSYLAQMGTALHETGSNFQFDFADFNGDGTLDFVAFKTSITGTNSTEVHVYNGVGSLLTAGTNTIFASNGEVIEENLSIPVGTLNILANGEAEITGDIRGNAGAILQSGSLIEFNGQLAIESQAGILIVTDNSGTMSLVGGSMSFNNVLARLRNLKIRSNVALSSSTVEADNVVVVSGTINLNTGSKIDAATVALLNSSVLKGTGVVDADVNAGSTGSLAIATVDPGQSPGILTTGSLLMRSNSRLRIELNGNSLGSGYDQVRVKGIVTLQNTQLVASRAYSPSVGREFRIIDNDGNDAVRGTFANLSEGAALTINGQRFHITYRGGTGNDVVLRRNRVPVGSNTAFSINEDTTLAASVAKNDADGNFTTVQLVSGPSHESSFQLSSSGAFSYRADVHYSGSDSFRYRVSDGELVSPTYTVSLSNLPVADAPNLSVTAAAGDENAPIPLSITSSLVDNDGSESLSMQISNVPVGAALNQGTNQGNGVWSLTPNQLTGLTITVPDDASFNLSVTATSTENANGVAASSLRSLRVNVANVRPDDVKAGPDQTVDEGDLVNLSGSFTDQGEDDGHSQVWSVVSDNGDVIVGQANDNLAGDSGGAGNSSFSFTPIDVGEYTVTYTVTDDDGGVEADEIIVTVLNVSSTLTLDSVEMIFENETPIVTGMYTDPGLRDSHTLVVDWDDPNDATNSTFEVPAINTLSIGQVVTSPDDATLTVDSVHLPTGKVNFTVTENVYLDDGVSGLSWSGSNGSTSDTSAVVVTVVDDDDSAPAEVGGTAETDVVVNNVAPVVSLNTVADIDENGTATLTGSFTDIGLSDSHRLTVAWDDPNNATDSVFELSDTNSLAGSYASTTDSAVLTITGVDFVTGTVEYSVQHQYLDDGVSGSTWAGDNGTAFDTSTINVLVEDDDAQSGDDESTFTVNNDAPDVSLNTVADITENGTATLTGSFIDIGLSDSHRLTVDWDDPNNATNSVFKLDDTNSLAASYASTTDSAVLTITSVDLATGKVEYSVQHQYLDDGVSGSTWSGANGTAADDSTINVLVEDDDAQSDEAETTFTVSNKGPVLTVDPISFGTQSSKATPDDMLTISGSFTDVGRLDSHRVVIDWGEISDTAVDAEDDRTVIDIASSDLREFMADHQFSTGGIFTITVTVTDDDTGEASDSSTEMWVSGVRLDPNTSELQIIGTTGRDDVDIKLSSDGGPDQLKVKTKLDKGSDGGSDADSDGGSDNDTDYFNVADVNKIVIHLCEEDDKAKIHKDVLIDAEIYGNDGKDKLTGGGGDDLIDGGNHDDDLKGGGGNDTVFGGSGDDKLDGGSDGGSDAGGDDILVGGDGDDDMKGGKGNDLMIGGAGKDKMNGGKDDDLMFADIAANENDISVLDAAMAFWNADDSASAAAVLVLISDGDKDDLKGDKGDDEVFGSGNDKLKD